MAEEQNGASGPSNWDRLVSSLAAYHRGDIDAALADWHEHAVVKLVGAPPGAPDTHAGKRQIREWLNGGYADHLEIQEQLICDDGETVMVRALTWSDATRRLGVAPLVATEVYVFQRGRITSLTWTISSESRARLQAAAPRA